MSFAEVTILKGKSGAEYTFMVVSRRTTFKPKPGVFVIGKSLEPQRFSFCYVGQSPDLSVRPLAPAKTECFNRFGADLIFVLEELDAAKRAQMVTDIVQAYAPSCNTP
ncbi:hypothetical protein [Candidatus Viadribacter manganicus]|uniref:Uncharacterized protein n=1 Tax=Candidatus Viadribacter manganicus TaxID=1759059 RepID=A0A1B1AHT2_9PROT|nr:hypothetical protein [Candidatus Viadribacter manganicus]ANP46118.1 hypothetical protein ATE48_09390 [Candidatus Viadribacter manganicus]